MLPKLLVEMMISLESSSIDFMGCKAIEVGER